MSWRGLPMAIDRAQATRPAEERDELPFLERSVGDLDVVVAAAGCPAPAGGCRTDRTRSRGPA